MPEAIYIAPGWVWNTRDPDMQPGYWQMPRADIGLGVLDLRTLPQMGSPGILNGPCFAVLSERDDKVGEYLGSWKESFRDGDETRLTVSRMLGIDKIPSTIDNPMALLLYLLTREADPTGQTRWKPLRVGRRRQLRLRIAGQEYTERVDEAHPTFTNTIEVFKTDYRRNKAEGIPAGVFQRWTGSEVLKLYGRLDAELAEQILPPEFSTEGLRVPETVLTETFPGTSATLGGDQTWTEVDGTWANSGGVGTHNSNSTLDDARLEADLSSDDHYVQVDIISLSNPGWLGPAARFAPAARDYYVTFPYTADNKQHLRKVINAVETDIATAVAITISLTETYKIQCGDDDIIRGYQAGVERITSSTETSITGNLRIGVASFALAPGVNSFDNFEAGDLGGGTGTTVTPSTLALATAPFAPTARYFHIPSPLALTSTKFAPVTRQEVTPATLPLATNLFTPTTRYAYLPSTLPSVLTPLAPSLRDTVTPATLALILSQPAPITTYGYTPTTLALTTGLFAPTVLFGTIVVTPTTLALILAEFIPIVRHNAIPPTLALTTILFAPIAGHNVIPSTLVLVTSLLAPAATYAYIPSTDALVLATFAPSRPTLEEAWDLWLRLWQPTIEI